MSLFGKKKNVVYKAVAPGRQSLLKSLWNSKYYIFIALFVIFYIITAIVNSESDGALNAFLAIVGILSAVITPFLELFR